jgi:3'-phosphoadenosine 5'-phosphosulfate sulfotransferase (PAPS reductase)/FAD synthetase
MTQASSSKTFGGASPEGEKVWTIYVCERRECGPISYRDVGHQSDGKAYHRWPRCLASVQPVEVVPVSCLREVREQAEWAERAAEQYRDLAIRNKERADADREALRDRVRGLEGAGEQLAFVALADVLPVLTAFCDATDSDKLREVASKLSGARMDWSAARAALSVGEEGGRPNG